MPATVTVETGAGVADANSYLSVAAFKTYATQKGWVYSSYTDDQIGTALIRATGWIDFQYRARWPGVRTYGTSQALLWPRKAGSIQYGVFVQDAYLTTVVDAEGLAIAINSVPLALVNATAEATWRELQEPGVLAPDLERGGAIRSFRAGSVGIEYANTASTQTTFTLIDGLLSGILGAPSNAFTGRAVRA